MFKVEFKTGNAAFHDENGIYEDCDYYMEASEVIRILKEVIKKLESGYREGACVDNNGNKVGSWKLD